MLSDDTVVPATCSTAFRFASSTALSRAIPMSLLTTAATPSTSTVWGSAALALPATRRKQATLLNVWIFAIMMLFAPRGLRPVRNDDDFAFREESEVLAGEL